MYPSNCKVYRVSSFDSFDSYRDGLRFGVLWSPRMIKTNNSWDDFKDGVRENLECFLLTSLFVQNLFSELLPPRHSRHEQSFWVFDLRFHPVILSSKNPARSFSAFSWAPWSELLLNFFIVIREFTIPEIISVTGVLTI